LKPRHHTDGGGDSEHVFALCSLLGFQFAPRIPDLKHRRLYSFGKPSDHPTLAPLIGGRINGALIRAYWQEILRIIASIRAGEIRDRTYENQQHRAPGLNLVVTAIILWNTRYLERAVAKLRQTEDVPDHLLVHLSPLGWEHVNLTGDYIWGPAREVSENISGLRPLRTVPSACLRAA